MISLKPVQNGTMFKQKLSVGVAICQLYKKIIHMDYKIASRLVILPLDYTRGSFKHFFLK
jgi:uncharacterized membrane protein